MSQSPITIVSRRLTNSPRSVWDQSAAAACIAGSLTAIPATPQRPACQVTAVADRTDGFQKTRPVLTGSWCSYWSLDIRRISRILSERLVLPSRPVPGQWMTKIIRHLCRDAVNVNARGCPTGLHFSGKRDALSSRRRSFWLRTKVGMNRFDPSSCICYWVRGDFFLYITCKRSHALASSSRFEWASVTPTCQVQCNRAAPGMSAIEATTPLPSPWRHDTHAVSSEPNTIPSPHPLLMICAVHRAWWVVNSVVSAPGRASVWTNQGRRRAAGPRGARRLCAGSGRFTSATVSRLRAPSRAEHPRARWLAELPTYVRLTERAGKSRVGAAEGSSRSSAVTGEAQRREFTENKKSPLKKTEQDSEVVPEKNSSCIVAFRWVKLGLRWTQCLFTVCSVEFVFYRGQWTQCLWWGGILTVILTLTLVQTDPLALLCSRYVFPTRWNRRSMLIAELQLISEVVKWFVL